MSGFVSLTPTYAGWSFRHTRLTIEKPKPWRPKMNYFINDLSAVEIVNRFFNDDEYEGYAYRMANDHDVWEEIQKYAAGAELNLLPIERFTCVGDGNGDFPAVIIALLEDVFDSWADSLMTDRWVGSGSVFGYLGELREMISNSGSSDRDSLRKLLGERQLKFVIEFLNKRLADPQTAEKWKRAFPKSFNDPNVALLFLDYALQTQRASYFHGGKSSYSAFNINEELSRSLCDAGFVFMREAGFADQGLGLSEKLTLARVFLNFTELIFRKGYYRDFADHHDFAEALKLNLFIGQRQELKQRLTRGDETLLRTAISAWTEMIKEKQEIIAGKNIEDKMPSALKFLLDIEEGELACCQSEWNGLRKLILEHTPGEREEAAKALYNKGDTLGELGRFVERIAVYDEIDKRFGKDDTPGVREWVAKALFSKGHLLKLLGKLVEAIAVYDEAVRRFGQDDTPGVRKWGTAALVEEVKTLHNKCWTLKDQGKFVEAIAVYDEIDRRFGQDDTPRVRKQVASALYGKGATLTRHGDPEEAIAVFNEIDRRFGQDDTPGVREVLANVPFFKNLALSSKQKQEIAVNDEIDRRFGQDDTPGVREVVASARNNK
jgi:tetratricopeptide (TPR) repeat protein